MCGVSIVLHSVHSFGFCIGLHGTCTLLTPCLWVLRICLIFLYISLISSACFILRIIFALCLDFGSSNMYAVDPVSWSSYLSFLSLLMSSFSSFCSLRKSVIHSCSVLGSWILSPAWCWRFPICSSVLYLVQHINKARFSIPTFALELAIFSDQTGVYLLEQYFAAAVWNQSISQERLSASSLFLSFGWLEKLLGPCNHIACV